MYITLHDNRTLHEILTFVIVTCLCVFYKLVKVNQCV